MSDPQLDSLEKAKEAIVEAASDPDLNEKFPTMSKLSDSESLRRVVEIAWRHQFTSDRHKFKQDVRETQEIAVKRAIQANKS